MEAVLDTPAHRQHFNQIDFKSKLILTTCFMTRLELAKRPKQQGICIFPH